MKRVLLIFLLSFGLAAGFTATAAAQEDKIQELQKKIEEERKQVEQLTKQEKLISLNLSQITEKLREFKLRISENENKRRRVEAELAALYAENEKLGNQIGGKKEEIEKRLVIWHKTYLLKVETPYLNFSDSILFENYMKYLFDYDRNLVESMVEHKKRLQANLDEIKRKKKEIEIIDADLKSKKHAQELLEKRQNELLRSTKKEKNIHAQNLKSAEQALRRLEAMLKKAEEIPQYAGRGLDKKKIPFPVKGEIVGHFGSEEGAIKGSKFVRKGVEIRADDGANVRVVDDGKMVYTGWIKGLGTICIISHGKSYYTVYGRLAQATRKAGEEVRKGEIIGNVGKEASFFSFPSLYFEIREKDKPVNPEPWLR